MNLLSACMYMHHMCAWHLGKSEEVAKSSGTGSHGWLRDTCWEPNSSPL